MQRGSLAPGRPVTGRPGALLLPLLLVAALAACGGERRHAASDRHRLPLGGDTIELGPDVTVHTVRLGGAAAGPALYPETVRARVGDVVRFVATDARGYAVSFEDSTLAPAARRFLESSRQLRGPPLITTGAAWVVSLKGAPAGRYRFRSLTRDASGLLVVQPAPAP